MKLKTTFELEITQGQKKSIEEFFEYIKVQSWTTSTEPIEEKCELCKTKEGYYRNFHSLILCRECYINKVKEKIKQ